MDLAHEVVSGVELVVTLSQREQSVLRLTLPWVRNIGVLSREACLAAYEEVDALFFPSLLESYGLPLVEAMELGLPVVCADRPYARWLCEDQAIYFDPLSAHSAWLAIRELQRRQTGGWQPDWRRARAKLFKDWNAVARQLVEMLELANRPRVQAGRRG